MNRIALAFTVLAFLVSCSRDVRLPGGYALEKWKDGRTFYLWSPDDSNREGGGAIEGTVQRIALTEDLIVVERHSIFRGDPDGWMVIATKAHKVSGPISEVEFADLQSKYHFRIESAADAWAAR
jgi:hypothetical protein